MTRREDSLNAAIDRKTGKAQTSARDNQIRELARAETNCAVMSQSEADRATYIRASGDQLRILAGKYLGERAAVGMFGGLAHSDELKLSAIVAKAEAERIAPTMFRNPANENSGGEG